MFKNVIQKTRDVHKPLKPTKNLTIRPVLDLYSSVHRLQYAACVCIMLKVHNSPFKKKKKIET
ncbi:hypothetical protein HanIR_Chr17g0888461 [Helianthus annuus]|nr:hypothetical protein HanIR_Chr17g0888461 [Helianthus annuus]